MQSEVETERQAREQADAELIDTAPHRHDLCAGAASPACCVVGLGFGGNLGVVPSARPMNKHMD